MCCAVLSCIWLFATPWTAARQASQSLEFSRQGYWSGLPMPSSRGSSWPRGQTQVSHIAGRFLLPEPPGRPISLIMNLIKSVILHYPICQHIKHRRLPQLIKVQLARYKLPWQIWKIGYIGSLIQDKGCQYKCMAVNTYSGYLVAIPFGKSNQTNTITSWRSYRPRLPRRNLSNSANWRKEWFIC